MSDITTDIKQFALYFYTTSERNKAVERLRSQAIKPMIISPASISTTTEGVNILKNTGMSFKLEVA